MSFYRDHLKRAPKEGEGCIVTAAYAPFSHTKIMSSVTWCMHTHTHAHSTNAGTHQTTSHITAHIAHWHAQAGPVSVTPHPQQVKTPNCTDPESVWNEPSVTAEVRATSTTFLWSELLSPQICNSCLEFGKWMGLLHERWQMAVEIQISRGSAYQALGLACVDFHMHKRAASTQSKYFGLV